MRRLLALALLAFPLGGALGCPTQIDSPNTPPPRECTLDEDCLAGSVCVDAVCVPPLVPAEGEGEGAEGEGDTGGDEGEGEGDVGDEGEGEGDTGGEGEGEGEPNPLAQTLTVTAGPELVDALPNCECEAQAPAANVNLSYSSSTGTCQKPSNPACGLNGALCPCDLGAGNGTAAWGGSRVEQPRTNEDWIIDEAVVHEGAADGLFTARVVMANDCLLAPGSLSLSVNNGCCLLDCDDAQACYDYSGGGSTCANFCQLAATQATNADCLISGPAPVRIHVDVSGTAGFVREWCATMSTNDAFDAIEIQRDGGRFEVVAFDPALTEVGVADPCP